MAIHTIKVRINEKQALTGLTEALADQVSEEIGEDVYSVKGMRAAIKADAKALLPKYMKNLLTSLKERADDNVMEATDDMLGWPGNWDPLNVLVGTYACDPDLASIVEESQLANKIKMVKVEAAKLGMKVVPDDE